MSYNLQEVNSCTKKLTFNFETLDLTTEIKAALFEKQKQVNIKGFRKGKAPLTMVEKIYGPQIESDALNSFVQNQLFEAITKEDLRVVGYPNFENMKYDSGKSVSFEAVVEVFPTFELKEIKGLSFTKEKVEISKEDVDGVSKSYLNSKAEMVELENKDAKVENGHFTVFNFEGETENGEKPESMKGEEFLLEIGSGQFIPGFEEGMIGLKINDKKVIDVTFPDDYQAADLQGSKVKFSVELLEIKEKKYPDLTDELAVEFGFESLEDFNTKNKENLLKQRETAAKQKLHQEILEKLVEENSFEVPMALIAQQETHLKEEVGRTLTSQGFNEEMMEDYFSKWSGDLTEKAKFQVCSGLILDTLAKKYNIETDDKDFEAKMEEVSGGSGLDIEQIKKYYESDPKLKQNILFAVREEKTFDKICEEVTVKEA